MRSHPITDPMQENSRGLANPACWSIHPVRGLVSIYAGALQHREYGLSGIANVPDPHVDETVRPSWLTRLRLGTMMLSLWSIALLLPYLSSSAGGATNMAGLWVPLLIGIVSSALPTQLERRSPQARTIALLFVFPLSVFVGVAVLESNGVSYGGAATLSGALGMLVYALTMASRLTRRPEQLLTVEPLGNPDLSGGSRTHLIRRLVVAIVGVGCFFIGTLPAWWPSSRHRWQPESRSAALTLTASFAVLIAVWILGGFLAPAMRRRKTSSSAKRRRGRVLLLVLTALFGAALWLVIQDVQAAG